MFSIVTVQVETHDVRGTLDAMRCSLMLALVSI